MSYHARAHSSRLGSTLGWETKYDYLKATPLGANENGNIASVMLPTVYEEWRQKEKEGGRTF